MQIMSHAPKNAYRGLSPHYCQKKRMICMICMICGGFEMFKRLFRRRTPHFDTCQLCDELVEWPFEAIEIRIFGFVLWFMCRKHMICMISE